jgi:hypothetical protein
VNCPLILRVASTTPLMSKRIVAPSLVTAMWLHWSTGTDDVL